MQAAELDFLDECLARIYAARQGPSWRRDFFAGLRHLRSLSDLRVLRAVERRTSSGADASVRDVAEELGIEHSSASRAVAAVVQAGYLDKTQSAQDQRRCLLVVTPLGRQALAEATDRRRAMMREHVADWSAADLGSLATLLGRLADDLEAP